jgi:hypothetical protein
MKIIIVFRERTFAIQYVDESIRRSDDAFPRGGYNCFVFPFLYLILYQINIIALLRNIKSFP